MWRVEVLSQVLLWKNATMWKWLTNKIGYLARTAGLLLCVLSGVVDAEEAQPWIMVDSRQQTLTVFAGQDKVLKHFPYVALGRGGVAGDRHRGDRTTPLGTFHVAWINPNSRFGIFFGLDFPSVENADRAYRDNLIDSDTYRTILDAVIERRVPPQDTPLGGQIGIHGLGGRDPRLHRGFNWTDGCIALTDAQIRSLARLVRIGTKVLII